MGLPYLFWYGEVVGKVCERQGVLISKKFIVSSYVRMNSMALVLEGNQRGITVAEFAREIGVSKQAVSLWIKRGMPIQRTGYVFIVPAEDAKRWLRRERLKYPVLYEDSENE